MPRKSIAAFALFGGELIANPGPVGAAMPSSPALARRLASLLPRRPLGYVVELGAGTGAVTAALLDRGLPANLLIPVERSLNMVRHLCRRFPQLNVVAGDAAELRSLLFDQLALPAGSVHCIVSSLPLRSLPKAEVARIMREVHGILPPDGRLIQYTYDLRRKTHEALAGFARLSTSIVWLNLPPARVDVFCPT